MKTLRSITPTGKAAAANDTTQAALDAAVAAARATQALLNATHTSSADPRARSLVQRLDDYRARHRLGDSTRDMETLAKRIGTSATYVYRYLTNDFRGDLKKFESALANFLDAEILKVEGNETLIEQDFIVRSAHHFLRQVKAHGYIGVGHGPAGRGKTCAAKLYAAKDRAAIYIHANVWSGGRHAIARAIASAVGITARNTKHHSLDEALVAKLTDSDRLIIIDNAQRLTEAARKWLSDFWHSTRVPTALIGNPEIERQWQRNDQHGSRVGLHRDITLDLATADNKPGPAARATAAQLIALHLPAASGEPEVLAEATRTLTAFGSCRAIVMRARLAANILAGGKITAPAQAWTAAATQLITA